MTHLWNLRSGKHGLQLRGTAVGLAFAILLGLTAISPSAQAQTLTVLYSFTAGADGSYPLGGVIGDSAGNLYGTAQYGGSYTCSQGLGCGTVFKVDATGLQTVLYIFTGGADGANPSAGLIRDAAGNLYGTTSLGGDLSCNFGGGCGTVFKLDPTGKETVLYAFTGTPDGAFPQADVIRDANGNFYGTTYGGGDPLCLCGTVFKLDVSGTETVLHTFSPKGDGRYPATGLVRDSAGNLFGTTVVGVGASGYGTLFKIDSAGNETLLHIFSGPDGAFPSTALFPIGPDLYGATNAGGTFFSGTVFKLDKAGNESVVHSFAGGAQGSALSGLTHDTVGNLYGSAGFDGTLHHGLVFKLDTKGKETVLHTFTGGADGADPHGNLIRDATGSLYSTTVTGGAFGFGTVFKITP